MKNCFFPREISAKLEYCSKYNPIERQLFAQLQHTIQGQLLTNSEQLKGFFEKATTKPNEKPPLQVIVRINTKEYKTGLPNAKNLIDSEKILYHNKLQKFNYNILP